MKQLQEKLTEYLKNRSIDQITIQSIQSTFGEITVKDEETDLYLPHCLVDKKYEEDKVEKMLTVLFKAGLSPNIKAYGGYTFLHQAIYGAEEGNKVIPYPLTFFERMIPLAKQYGYDVNSKDEDGDTLIHSAIYSEDYYDDVEPLIRLLGKDFNLTAKNKENQSLLSALEKSLVEAEKNKNEKWKSKLLKEKDIITDLMKAIQNKEHVIIAPYSNKTVSTIYDYADINARYERIKNEIYSIDINTKTQRITELKKEITSSGLDTSQVNQLVNQLKQKEQEIKKEKKLSIEKRVSNLNVDSKIEECTSLKNEISTSTLSEENKNELIKKLAIIENKIRNRIFLEEFRENVNNIHTISDIKHCLTEAANIKEEALKKEMIDKLNDKLRSAKEIEKNYEKALLELNGLKHNVNSSLINEYKIGDGLNHNYRETLDIQIMETETKNIEQLIKTISNQLRKLVIINIQREIDQLKEIQADTGIDLITDLNESLDFNPLETPTNSIISKKKKKEKRIVL